MSFKCFNPSLRGCFKSSSRENGEDTDDGKRGPRDGKALPREVPEVAAGFTRYTVDELVDATDSFNEEWKLGEGGFGKVYLAELGVHFVAIKRLDTEKTLAVKKFEAELALAGVNHPNLLKVLGYGRSEDDKTLLLVYEYMSEGSLQGLWDKINAPNPTAKPLDWKTRLKIAHGVAKGLNYLHTMETPIIHTHLKCENILLDADYEPKIADFGLAKEGAVGKTHVSTFGYYAPEYINSGHFTFQTDVYSYGVVLLQLLTGGREVVFGTEHIVDWARPLIKAKRFTELVDPWIKDQSSNDHLRDAFLIADNCVTADLPNRHTMKMVVLMLSSLASPEEDTGSHSGSSKNWGLVEYDEAATTTRG